MKDLEKIFKDHYNEFNDSEPLEGHFENFLNKLHQRSRKRKTDVVSGFLKVAAIVIFVVVSGVAGYQYHKMQTDRLGLGAISPEYKEVESHYMSNINNQLSTIKRLGALEGAVYREVLDEDLKDMDEHYKQLKEELRLHPRDERVINAMIEYYETKTDILDRVIEQLYQIRQQTESNLNVSA